MPTKDPAKAAEYNRRYYANAGKVKVRAAKAAAIARNVAYVQRVKHEQPCTDCRRTYPYWVMEFDHLRDKDRNITKLVYAAVSLAKIDAELAKCELVCANCHRQRTHRRLMESSVSGQTGEAPVS